MSIPIELADELTKKLNELEDADPGGFVPFSEFPSLIAELNVRLPDNISVPQFLDDLIAKGWIESNGADFDRTGQGFRITAKGQIRAASSVDYTEQFSKAINALPALDLGDSGPKNEENQSPDELHRRVNSIDWTGKELVLVDANAIKQLRTLAVDLRDKVSGTNFRSDEDRQDLTNLSGALVSIAEMAEPDLTIVDRILKHPKFKIYVALFTAIATIRGALDI